MAAINSMGRGGGGGGKKKGAATPIFVACDNGDVATVQDLLAKDAAQLESRNGDGWTPLIQACYAGELEVVEALLAAGANAAAVCKVLNLICHSACTWHGIFLLPAPTPPLLLVVFPRTATRRCTTLRRKGTRT